MTILTIPALLAELTHDQRATVEYLISREKAAQEAIDEFVESDAQLKDAVDVAIRLLELTAYAMHPAQSAKLFLIRDYLADIVESDDLADDHDPEESHPARREDYPPSPDADIDIEKLW